MSENLEEGEHFYIEIDTGHKRKNVVIGNIYRSSSFSPEKFVEKYPDGKYLERWAIGY